VRIAKSSKEQDGYEQAPDTISGARLIRSGPLEAAPEAVSRRRQENKKAEKKFQGGYVEFFDRSLAVWLIFGGSQRAAALHLAKSLRILDQISKDGFRDYRRQTARVW
jgi:hypothetical protein